MENMIKYYYNLNNIKINKTSSSYDFYYQNKLYKLIKVTDINEKELTSILSLTENNKVINKIIPNKFGKYLSYLKEHTYLLLEEKNKLNTPLNLCFLNIINNDKKAYGPPPNWANMWAEKIDYLELQINETGKKYPNLIKTLNYYIGLTENAISYYNYNVKKEETNLTLSHKVLDTDNFFNPLNIKIDHKSRDLAEYIKLSFYNNNKNIYYELYNYFNYNYYTKNDMTILFSRILYPSFYFKLYDEIIQGNKKDEELVKLITTSASYERYLYQIYLFLNNYYHLEEVVWLRPSPH